MLEALLAGAAALERSIGALFPAVVHGDCHLGNVLRQSDSAGGHLVWVDWQETGVASPAMDLAFCFARAVPDGLTIPVDQMLDVYRRAREVSLEDAVLRRAVLAAELVVLMASWPQFAHYNSPDGISRVHHRAHQLVTSWCEGPR